MEEREKGMLVGGEEGWGGTVRLRREEGGGRERGGGLESLKAESKQRERQDKMDGGVSDEHIFYPSRLYLRCLPMEGLCRVLGEEAPVEECLVKVVDLADAVARHIAEPGRSDHWTCPQVEPDIAALGHLVLDAAVVEEDGYLVQPDLLPVGR